MKGRIGTFWSLAAGVTVGLIVVAGIVVLPQYVFSHTECELRALGNVTAWTPDFVAAAPYKESVVVSDFSWTNFTTGGGWVNKSGLSTGLNATMGNVTAGVIQASNWTVVELQNVTVAGPALSTPCTTSLVALRSSPWEWTTLGFTVPLASNLTADQGLPTSLNTSFLCSFWN